MNTGRSVVAHIRGDPSERVVFPMRRAAMSWKWCSSCVSYWDRVDDVPVPWRPGSDHPLVSDRFGFEMQLDINVERRQNVWAYPLWGTAQPPRGHGYTNSGLVFPRIWSATFPYAYADDYEGDSVFGNGATYSLTIGSAHRPYAGQKMRWSQWLVPGPDAHDRVRPSFQPLRFEINNNDANSFYCGHYKRPSACFEPPRV